MIMNVVRLSVLLPVFAFGSHRSALPHSPAKLRLTLATLHAAALTSPRVGADSVDGPYFLVSILGSRKKPETIQLPANGHLSIHQGEALGERQLVDLSLEPGDTVRLLVSVLEAKMVAGSDEAAAATASGKALSQPAEARAGAVSSALSAVIAKEGAHWLGSATLVLTNEAGTVYWHALECVATCKVLSGGSAKAFAAPSGAPLAGVVELSGGGGTYHMQLQGQTRSDAEPVAE